jgi:hypothetical protein
MFGAKPLSSPIDTERHCQSNLIFHQYVVPIHLEYGNTVWTAHQPLPLVIPLTEVYTNRGDVKEKNWMPFIYDRTLHVVHSLHPVRIYIFNSAGTAVSGYLTYADGLLNASGIPLLEAHSGPPLVSISQFVTHTSGTFRTRHLTHMWGLVHYYNTDNGIKRYHHYFFKMQPWPPFSVCAISREINLTILYTEPEHRRYMIYVSGLWYDQARRQLVVTYGTADAQARMQIMSISEANALFKGQDDLCARHQVMRRPLEGQ